VTTQLAIALLLLVGASLVVKSMHKLTAVDLGFEPRGLATASINLITRYRDPARLDQFVETLRTRLLAAPGVDAVAFGPVPLIAGRDNGLREGFNMIFTGPRAPNADRAPTVWVKFVDAGYVEMFRVRVSAGRAIGPSDDALAPAVALMNRRAVPLFFPDGSAVDRSLTGVPSSLSGGRPITVIGVVDDVRQRDVTMAAEPEIFLPLAQQGRGMSETTVTIQTRGDAGAILPTLRRALKDVDPALATSRLTTMDDVVARSLSRYTFLLTLFGVFSSIAVTLAMVGLFAIVAYSVTRRTREIGIRMALGAARSHVVGLVGGETVRLVAMGAILGLGAAFALSGTLASLLYEVSPIEPDTFVAGVLLLVLAAFAAALIPMRRAIVVDPTITLRAE
jgi:predicted permease